MPKTRTQLYLTDEQRRKLDEVGRRRGRKMAEMVRDAVDAYLAGPDSDLAAALDGTFGRLPDLQVPGRDEWNR